MLELSVAVTVTLYSLFSTPSSGSSKSGAELNVSSPAFEMLKRPLLVPDKDQVTVSFALYVDTAVWFSWTDTVSLPDITILTLSLGSSVTDIATFFWALAPDVSVTVTVKLYTLLVP